jgi:hypothetical protein
MTSKSHRMLETRHKLRAYHNRNSNSIRDRQKMNIAAFLTGMSGVVANQLRVGGAFK